MKTLDVTPRTRTGRRPANSFLVAIDHGRRHSQVTAGGDLDAEHAWELRDCLRELADSGRSKIVLDMASVRIVDFGALGILIGGLVRLERRGAQVAVLPAKSATHQYLERAGLHPRVDFES